MKLSVDAVVDALNQRTTENNKRLWQLLGSWWLVNHDACIIICVNCGVRTEVMANDAWEYADAASRQHRPGCGYAEMDRKVAASRSYLQMPYCASAYDDFYEITDNRPEYRSEVTCGYHTSLGPVA